jgi:dCTP diphosphatase
MFGTVLEHAHCRRRAKCDFAFFRLRLGDGLRSLGGRAGGRAPPPALAICLGSALISAMPATDATATFAELKTRILAFARERDWEQFHAPKNLSMALAAEAAELMEHFLWATPEQSQAIVRDPVKRRRIEEEIADVAIYALEFANVTGIDLAAAMEAKMAANALKYPVEKARGRAEKYDEL